MSVGQTHNIKTAETQIFRPDFFDTKKLFKQDKFLGQILLYFGIVAFFLSILGAFFFNNKEVLIFVLTTSLIYLSALFGIYSSNEEQNNKEAIIPNEEGNDYLWSVGNEVKKFYGDAVKSSKKPQNMIRPILFNAETVKRHFLVMATIGAGKSVLMKGLIEQHAILGGGCFIIDGKGTDEFAKEIYGLVASVGREDDFVHLNFLDMNNTHTINPLLSGSALSIYEILIALIIGEEDVWVVKQKEYMKNILKLMVWRRDNEPNFIFDFSALTEMMSLPSLVKKAIEYKYLAKINPSTGKPFDVGVSDYIKFVASSIDVDFQDFLNGDKDDPNWVKEMMKKCEGEGQGVYDSGVSAGAWRGIITNLSSDYGRIFNDPKPSISLWEATQRNKIIFVTLPTMDSDTTPKELGRLLLGLIKGVAAQKAKYAKEPKIPFVCFCDELGSYVVEGYGRLESKSRSLGISMVPFFQSPAQIDAIGKGDLERREIIDVTGVHILMKNMHPDTTELYAKFVEKRKVLTKSYAERKEFAEGQGNTEENYNVEEKDAIEHNEVVNMNNGEMMVFANGFLHRAVARAETTLLKDGKKITYEGKSDIKIPLTQYVPKAVFF